MKTTFETNGIYIPKERDQFYYFGRAIEITLKSGR